MSSRRTAMSAFKAKRPVGGSTEQSVDPGFDDHPELHLADTNEVADEGD